MVLTLQQRIDRGKNMRRLRQKLQHGRDIAQARLAPTDAIKRRALKAARQIVRARVAGQLGKQYSNLSAASKIIVDKMIVNKQPLVFSIAKKILPKIKQQDLKKHRFHKKNIRESKWLYHSTDGRNLASIKKHGLVPGGASYIDKDDDEFVSHLSNKTFAGSRNIVSKYNKFNNKPATLRFKRKNAKWQHFVSNKGIKLNTGPAGGHPIWITREKIKPQHIQVKQPDGSWKKLNEDLQDTATAMAATSALIALKAKDSRFAASNKDLEMRYRSILQRTVSIIMSDPNILRKVMYDVKAQS